VSTHSAAIRPQAAYRKETAHNVDLARKKHLLAKMEYGRLFKPVQSELNVRKHERILHKFWALER